MSSHMSASPDPEVKILFDQLETGQPARLSNLFEDPFLFCGPESVSTVRKADFLALLPKITRDFERTGFRSKRILSIGTQAIGPRSLMATVRWEMTYDTPRGPLLDEIAASFLLRRSATGWRILVQVDHQDLGQRVQELGLV